MYNTTAPSLLSLKPITTFAKHHAIALIVCFAILIRIPIIFVAEKNGFQHTTWRQTDTASIARNFYNNGYNLFYPQINWGGNGPGYVETEFQLYPFMTALLYHVFGEHIGIGMSVSLLFSVGTALAFYALARRIVSARAALIALIFFVVSPLYIRYSVAFMPESTMFFFYVTALYFFQLWLDEQKRSILFLAAVCTALAILVKPTSIIIAIVFFLLLLERYRLRLFTNWYLWLFALICLLPGIVWYLHARNLYLVYGNTFGVISGGDNKFDNLKYWFSPVFYYSLIRIDITTVFAWGGILPFAIGVVLAWRKRQPKIILFGILTIFIYYMLIPRYTRFADYYHIFAIPFAALSVGVGTLWLFNKVKLGTSLRAVLSSKYSLASILAIFLFSVSILTSYRDDLSVYPQPLRDCGLQVAQYVPANTLIIVSSTSLAIDDGAVNNFQEPDIFYYSHRYGWSLPVEWHTPDYLKTYHQQGAQYFVIYSPELYHESTALAAYLQQNTQQVGPGIDSGCGIYKFNAAS